MSPTNNSSVWYRYPGSSFYILANSVSTPRLYVQPSYYNQSSGSNYPLQKWTVDEAEDIEDGYHADEESDDSFSDVGRGESGMDSLDGLKSYDEEEGIGNGDLDALLYSPISICSWLSNGTKELMAENLGGVDGESRGDIDGESRGDIEADESSPVVVEDGAVVGDVMEDEDPADLQLEGHNEIGIGPVLRKGRKCTNDSSEARSSKKLVIAEEVERWPRRRSE